LRSATLESQQNRNEATLLSKVSWANPGYLRFLEVRPCSASETRQDRDKGEIIKDAFWHHERRRKPFHF
ncbi:MAG: hypothetical protein AAGA96_18260, partial [Verrucomicrobiota bacterium]